MFTDPVGKTMKYTGAVFEADKRLLPEFLLSWYFY